MDEYTLSSMINLCRNGVLQICPYSPQESNCGAWCPAFAILEVGSKTTVRLYCCGRDIEIAKQQEEFKDHKQRHILLHRYLDELVADWITHTEGLPSRSTIFELMQWANCQTYDPTEIKDKGESENETDRRTQTDTGSSKES